MLIAQIQGLKRPHLVMRLSAEGTPAAQGCDLTFATAACIGPRDSGIASFTCLTTKYFSSDIGDMCPFEQIHDLTACALHPMGQGTSAFQHSANAWMRKWQSATVLSTSVVIKDKPMRCLRWSTLADPSAVRPGGALIVIGDERVAAIWRREHGTYERMQQGSIAVANAMHRPVLRHQEPLPWSPQRLHASVEILRSHGSLFDRCSGTPRYRLPGKHVRASAAQVAL